MNQTMNSIGHRVSESSERPVRGSSAPWNQPPLSNRVTYRKNRGGIDHKEAYDDDL